jgi:hypothetical protein
MGNTKLAAFAMKAQMSEDHSRRVIGKKDGDDGARDIDEQKETCSRAAGMTDGHARHPVKDALVTGGFGQQHHPDEEQVHIQTFVDGVRGAGERQEPGEDEQQGPAPDPPGFGDAARADEHEQDAAERDGPDEGGGEMRQSVVLLSISTTGLSVQQSLRS